MITRALLALAAILWCSPVSAQSSAGSIEGLVVNYSTGAPVAGATVTLSLTYARTLSSKLGSRPSQQVKTDEQGRFIFRGLDAAIYTIGAERDGFLKPRYRSGGSHTVVLGENQVLSNALLRLLPGASVAAKVMRSDGEPLADALVRLLRPGNNLSTGRPEIFPAASCRTDRLGECRASNLAQGEYLLEASPPTRPASSFSQPKAAKPALADIVTFYPRAASPAAATPIRLGSGEVRAEIRLLRVPTVQVSGRAIDPVPEPGTPFLQLFARNAAGTSLQVESHPGEDGSFLIRNVPPGSYYLTAQKSAPIPSRPGPNGTRIVSLSLPDMHPVLAAAALPIEVGGSNLDGVNLKMEPTFDVDVNVAVEQNAQCWPTGGIDPKSPMLFLFPEIPLAARSRSATFPGYPFVLKNVAPARYFVTLGGASRCYLKSIRYGGREAEDGLLEIARSGTLEITLAPGARLNGTVVDDYGRPAARATVTLIPKDGRVLSVRSNQYVLNGSFSLSGIPPGSYSLFAWEDSLDTMPSPELVKAFEKRAQPLTLAADKAPVQVSIGMIPASESAKISGLTSTPLPVRAQGSIGGRVLDAASGAPIENASLTLKGWGDATPQASARTDARGLFEFPKIEPGYYDLSAQHPRFAPATTARKDMPWGALVVGEGQQVGGADLKLAPQP